MTLATATTIAMEVPVVEHWWHDPRLRRFGLKGLFPWSWADVWVDDMDATLLPQLVLDVELVG